MEDQREKQITQSYCLLRTGIQARPHELSITAVPHIVRPSDLRSVHPRPRAFLNLSDTSHAGFWMALSLSCLSIWTINKNVHVIIISRRSVCGFKKHNWKWKKAVFQPWQDYTEARRLPALSLPTANDNHKWQAPHSPPSLGTSLWATGLRKQLCDAMSQTVQSNLQ